MRYWLNSVGRVIGVLGLSLSGAAPLWAADAGGGEPSGLVVSSSWTLVGQQFAAAGGADSQWAGRGDINFSLPLPIAIGVEQQVFAHVRLGRGAGLVGSSIPGGSWFDGSIPILAQAWYQANMALPVHGGAANASRSLEITVGKLDPFAFFDQNALAGDETRQFINAAFVHNPLLDTGGDMGADMYGFLPGLRTSLRHAVDDSLSWRFSVGLVGKATRFVQAEVMQTQGEEWVGNYRLYAWNNRRAQSSDPSHSLPEWHSGWGLSMDQRLGKSVAVFARWGQSTAGHVPFDRALTLGGEWNGHSWGRANDGLGLAIGFLRSRSVALPTSTERVVELYYRCAANKQWEITPNLQYSTQPSGDATAPSAWVLGLRIQINP